MFHVIMVWACMKWAMVKIPTNCSCFYSTTIFSVLCIVLCGRFYFWLLFFKKRIRCYRAMLYWTDAICRLDSVSRIAPLLKINAISWRSPNEQMHIHTIEWEKERKLWKFKREKIKEEKKNARIFDQIFFSLKVKR